MRRWTALMCRGSGGGSGVPGTEARAEAQSARASLECTLQAVIRLCLTAFEVADGEQVRSTGVSAAVRAVYTIHMLYCQVYMTCVYCAC